MKPTIALLALFIEGSAAELNSAPNGPPADGLFS
jgi:hypothetical protein